jgi:hypothetical protein
MFSRDTIQKFTNNASGMKKLAARDFEDLLQVYTTYDFSHCPLLTHISAQWLFSKAFFLCRMTLSL